LPRWLVIAASIAIVFHLSAVIVRSLNMPSGPWLGDRGPVRAGPPTFASTLFSSLPGEYLKAVRLTQNYHFQSNSPGTMGIAFEARFKDHDGNPVTLTFPDKNANRWVQHRQKSLAFALTDDQRVMPPPLQTVAAPGKAENKIRVWDGSRNSTEVRLKWMSENEIPREGEPNYREIWRPSPFSSLVVNSYARYLCRTYGVDKVEIVRIHQSPIPPDALFEDFPEQAFAKGQSNFGELPQ
jgi:hypothetical protein